MADVSFHRLLLWIWGIAALLHVSVTACGATSREPCTQGDLGKIIAAHEARLAQECFGQGVNCHERKAENARFEAELRSWTRCDRESGPR